VARYRTPLVASAAALTIAGFCHLLRPLHIPAQDGRALEFTDRHGLALGTLLTRDQQHTAFVPIERISPFFVRAIVDAEDRRFFQHGAVDGVSLARAFAGALQTGRSPSGASTISIQLARLLVPVGSGLPGKIAEVVEAQRLENGASKRAILEAYCNRVPMGANVYGVEAAALTYFGVGSTQLDLAQAALLAAIPNDPVRLDPYAHSSALRVRQRYVLSRMAAAGDVSAGDAASAAAEDIALRPRGGGIVAAAHLLFWLAPAVPPQRTVVRTTIDLPLQRFVEAQVRDIVRSLGDHDVHHAAVVVVDNHTREVLAYVGSPDYFADENLGRNDGAQALRQPGSTLKPFLYELALERRAIRPGTILLDAPAAYAIPGGRLYQPSDYSGRFMGPVRVRLALADSLNVPAVRVLESTGVPAFLDRLHALGFAHLQRPAAYYGLGLTLGGGEVSLYELARAYVTMARGGAAADLVAIAPEGSARASPSAADPAWPLVTDILADKHARAAAFGVNSVLALPFATAVKTGTSSDFRDTWTVGFTRDYTVAVWAGNFDGRPMRHVSGVTGAGPLWNRIMLHLHESREPASFPAPLGYVRRPICADSGLRPARNCRTVVTEWLDRGDLVAYEQAPPSLERRMRLAIAFPRDGDRFALVPGASQRIAIDVVAASTRATRVTVDGRLLPARDGAFVWPLRIGQHEIVARAGSDSATARIAVEPPPRPAHVGFSLVGR
jgi:penicillin-binding protein 1C